MEVYNARRSAFVDSSGESDRLRSEFPHDHHDERVGRGMRMQADAPGSVRLDDLPLQCTVGDALDNAAARWADEVGWIFDDQRVTFAEMRQRSDGLAAALESDGVGRGDVVAVWLPNMAEWAYTFFACARLGAMIASLNTRCSVDEARYVLEHSAARALVFRHRFLKVNFYEMLAEIDTALAPVLLASEGESNTVFVTPLGRPVTQSEVRPVATLVVAPESPPRCAVRPTDPFLVQYTSGSTAQPKGAVLSHEHVLNFGMELTMRLGVGFGDTVLNTQPFYHVGGACNAVPAPLGIGCVVVSPEYYEPRRVLELLQRERCIARGGMSTMYLREMQLDGFRDYDTSSLRAGWTIGPPGVLDEIHDGYPLDGLVQLYGSSEGGVTCGHPSDPWEIRRLSAGAAVAGTEVGIFDSATGKRLEGTATGEIRLRGWACLLAYLGQEASPVDADGWFHTGDLGWLDTDGRLYYDGRLKDMIKPGGENVSAQEVEAVISTHPAVSQVAVVGIPDRDLMEAVLAVIQLQPGVECTAEEITDFCKGTLAGFRVPKYVRFIDHMPLTDSGKVKKLALTERYTSEFETAR